MAVDKLVDSAQLDADLEDIADAIRAKGGTSSQMAFPSGFVSAVQAIPTGGITPTGTKQITANGSNIDVESYKYADVAVPNTYSAGDEGKVVSNGALVAQSSDTVTENDTYDTTTISSLTVNVSGGGGYTVDEIASLSEPSGEITINITSLPQYGLRGRPITRVHAPNLNSIAQYDFSGTSLTRIESTDFPKLKYISGAFESISTLTYVNMPAVTSGGTSIAYAFRSCSNLVECYLPNATANIDRTCYGCKKLQIFDGGAGSITNNTSFQNCSALRTLILRNTSAVQTLNAWSANCLGGIYSNPTESTVYVPQALISTYQSATNWSSAYAAGVTFAAIEGSQYE